MLDDFHFAEPIWLTVGAAALALIVALAAFGAWRRRRALRRFTEGGRAVAQSVSRWRRGAKLALLLLGVAGLFAAAARPRWGSHYETTERRGIDLLFAVDTSRSMRADDVRPDRLTRAKLAVRDLVREFEGDRAGLVAFAGEPFLQCPMTLDRDVFERSLAELDTEIIPRGGTNLAAAIRESVAAFGEVDHDKLLVLLTDGENLEGEAVEAARWAAEQGVRVFTVGVGTAEPTLVSIEDERGERVLVRDAAGQPVRSALDEATLRAIAEAADGAYEPLGASGEGLARLYATHLSDLPRHAVAARQRRVYREGFQWPLGLGLLLLLLEPMIGERRRRWWRRLRSGRVSGLASASAAAALALLVAPTAFAQDWATSQQLWHRDGPAPRQAEEAYRRGDYEAASRLWDEAGRKPEHAFNAGTAAYRAGRFEEADSYFSDALRGARPALQQRAYYDLGNARFRRGEAALEQDVEATKAAWRASVEAYESALALDADDDDARHNLELVRRRLAALEEEPPSQSEQDGQSGEGQEQDRQSGEGQQQNGQSGEGRQQDGQSGEGQQQDGRSGEGQQQDGQSGQGQQQDGQSGEGQEQDGQSGEEGQAQDGQSGEGQAQPGAAEGEEPTGEPEFAGSTGPGEPTGRLSREQAMQLLRSMGDRERRLPLMRRRGETNGHPSGAVRNW